MTRPVTGVRNSAISGGHAPFGLEPRLQPGRHHVDAEHGIGPVPLPRWAADAVRELAAGDAH